MQHKPFQTEIEIFTKPAFRDAALKVLVGGGDDADIDGGGSRCADTIKGVFLQHPEKFALVVQAKVADLIEENSAVVREFEISLSIGHGAGETPAQVAEQFAFKQFRRNGRHVDGNEGPAARGPKRWTARANSSFPVPGSPVMRTVSDVRAAFLRSRNSESKGVCGDNRELFTFLPQALLFAITQRNVHRADCANGRQFLFEFTDPPASGFFLDLGLVDSRPQRIGRMLSVLAVGRRKNGGQARRFKILFQGINRILPAYQRFPNSDHFFLKIPSISCSSSVIFRAESLCSRSVALRITSAQAVRGIVRGNTQPAAGRVTKTSAI